MRKTLIADKSAKFHHYNLPDYIITGMVSKTTRMGWYRDTITTTPFQQETGTAMGARMLK